MHKRSNEPFLWLLFSAGGVVAAMVIPIHLLLFGLAFVPGTLPLALVVLVQRWRR